MEILDPFLRHVQEMLLLPRRGAIGDHGRQLQVGGPVRFEKLVLARIAAPLQRGREERLQHGRRRGTRRPIFPDLPQERQKGSLALPAHRQDRFVVQGPGIGDGPDARLLLGAEIAEPVFGMFHDLLEARLLLLRNISAQEFLAERFIVGREFFLDIGKLLRSQRQCQIRHDGHGTVEHLEREAAQFCHIGLQIGGTDGGGRPFLEGVEEIRIMR